MVGANGWTAISQWKRNVNKTSVSSKWNCITWRFRQACSWSPTGERSGSFLWRHCKSSDLKWHHDNWRSFVILFHMHYFAITAIWSLWPWGVGPGCSMPKARSNCKDEEKRRFYLFERCSGGILNLRFDSDILESFYSDCSFPRTRGRFRFGAVAEAIVCGIWLIYFAVLRPKLWPFYVIGLTVCGIISLIFCAVSFATFFKKYCLCISGAYAFASSVFVLLPYIPKIPPVSLTYNLSIVIQLILFTYTMNPLRLWQQLLVCGPLSLLHVILSATRFGSVGGSTVFIHVTAHLCVHSIGIVLHLMSQVWSNICLTANECVLLVC